jgi:hypothetical protein
MAGRQVGPQLDDDVAAAGKVKGQGIGVGHRRKILIENEAAM